MRIKNNLTENENSEICDLISKISPYIRFVGIISKTGELLSYFRRDDMTPLLDEKRTMYQFAQIAIKTELEEQFDEQLGETEFIWEERKKIQTISFSVLDRKVWITIDKNVIRTEVIRIIDGCLPVVKRYS
jgi:heme oxygenase|tara:strand:+ start:1553 stop:1945 length:393 start_codon:yes stop_codon:yes gene_type:complete